jgi:hypothetical protein
LKNIKLIHKIKNNKDVNNLKPFHLPNKESIEKCIDIIGERNNRGGNGDDYIDNELLL